MEVPLRNVNGKLEAFSAGGVWDGTILFSFEDYLGDCLKAELERSQNAKKYKKHQSEWEDSFASSTKWSFTCFHDALVWK